MSSIILCLEVKEVHSYLHFLHSFSRVFLVYSLIEDDFNEQFLVKHRFVQVQQPSYSLVLWFFLFQKLEICRKSKI